jgi:hypothetical protein
MLHFVVSNCHAMGKRYDESDFRKMQNKGLALAVNFREKLIKNG